MILLQAWCGSGYKRGNEQCDDGDLSYACDPARFSCPPTAGSEDPKQLRSNDGCNSFCEIETSFGWECTPGPQYDGFGGTFMCLLLPAPVLCRTFMLVGHVLRLVLSYVLMMLKPTGPTPDVCVVYPLQRSR